MDEYEWQGLHLTETRILTVWGRYTMGDEGGNGSRERQGLYGIIMSVFSSKLFSLVVS